MIQVPVRAAVCGAFGGLAAVIREHSFDKGKEAASTFGAMG
jgi:hypothetical protein